MMMANRYMLNVYYPLPDFEGTDDQLFLISSEGTEQFNTTKQKEEHAHTFVNCYWASPGTDSKTGQSGINISVVQSLNFGGSIPNMLRDKIGPMQATQAIEGVQGYFAALK
eukprot:CAMPEP_0116877618 /NCGR_PEP_ID=MMETSP0463-20121206/9380_1 /TAXON_ID=181622 /ORGANISM="Strombidinopsis sp, Strain SopsisLIS2011" /LENGTH=110 /DNA_ID=CAMNT_0004525043 /DNA_START=370 /DNA_END=702 /DNA_ORIENTATION=-